MDKCEVKVMTSGQCWGTHGTTTPGRRFGVVSALPPRRERNTVIQQNGPIIFLLLLLFRVHGHFVSTRVPPLRDFGEEEEEEKQERKSE